MVINHGYKVRRMKEEREKLQIEIFFPKVFQNFGVNAKKSEILYLYFALES